MKQLQSVLKTQNVQKMTPVNFYVVRKKCPWKLIVGARRPILIKNIIFDRPTDNMSTRRLLNHIILV